MLILHLGGVDSLSHRTGIHGVHLGHIEYIATDPTRTTIPWVQRTNPDGTRHHLCRLGPQRRRSPRASAA